MDVIALEKPLSVEIYSQSSQVGQYLFGGGYSLVKCLTYLSVVVESFDCFQWNGVDRIWPDKLIDIQNIGVGRVLGAGTAPEDALHTGASLALGAPEPRAVWGMVRTRR